MNVYRNGLYNILSSVHPKLKVVYTGKGDICKTEKLMTFKTIQQNFDSGLELQLSNVLFN